ncbi:hypothetical protein PUMCH_003090 [Australozyma saopauloensis]|uniref:Guanine nucleotide-binding protein alpha-2 subunit n=1 Tax=Australozyma saopauloensis TaxID=291208 RepID=A0AAX4HBU9_9ASCO|nr:hypothetical protein PUMCH_003090 [[Candida] saopauloensis]
MGSCTSKDPIQEAGTQNKTTQKRTQQPPAAATQTKTDPLAKPQEDSAKLQNGDAATKEQTSVSQVTNSVELSNDLIQTNEKDVKILLLGSGESGKSTIVKQMKILHKDGFSEAEAYDYKPFVYKNVLDCIKNIINAIVDLAPDLIAPQGSEPTFTKTEDGSREHILSYDELSMILDYEHSINTDEPFSQEIAALIEKISGYPEVLDFIKHNQGKFYLIDSTQYFFTEIKRIASPDYMPTPADILRTRKKTSGIYDFRFQMGGTNVHMFDVGGQRSERKKWIHCFDNVQLIIFCVALSEYDQVLLEESSQNRLEESLTLFDSVVNSRWFARTSVVLFLNKIDIFANKLPYSPLEDHFPDYNGGDNINKAVKYILWRFMKVNRSGLNIYPHVTQATDTSNIELVFAALKETILENSLRDSGIL